MTLRQRQIAALMYLIDGLGCAPADDDQAYGYIQCNQCLIYQECNNNDDHILSEQQKVDFAVKEITKINKAEILTVLLLKEALND